MKPSIPLLVLACSSPLAACGSPGGSTAAPPSNATARSSPRERLAPCNLDGVTGPVLCGSYAVWENRTTRQGRKIDLRIVVLPALGPEVAPDPVFELAGGPGDAAGNSVRGWAQQREVRAHRDVVLVDQRGTGASHRLDCKIPRDPADVQAFFEPSLPPA